MHVLDFELAFSCVLLSMFVQGQGKNFPIFTEHNGIERLVRCNSFVYTNYSILAVVVYAILRTNAALYAQEIIVMAQLQSHRALPS